MAKRKKVNRKKQKANLPIQKTDNFHVNANDLYLPKSLQIIAKRRKGGSVNLVGLSFQFSYALWKILHFLVESDPNRTIRLEGIEDIDVIDAKVHLITAKDYEFIQVKHSENKMDASSFWNKNILQNFIEAYLENPQATFRLVHNMKLANGNLKELALNSFTDTGLEYWRKKIENYKDSTKGKLNWKNFNMVDFLDSIKFEKLSEQVLEKDCKQIIIDKFQITTGNEQQYMNTLLFKVFEWSKNRTAINSEDINTIIQEVKDDMARGIVNPAIQEMWISKVTYDENLKINVDNYYEGKAARPIHIAKELPVRREHWEEQIEKTINDFDITVLKSSSGQGKSTLAWQIGKKFSENGYALYELHWCSDEEKVGSIISFLHSRVKIGETPLIIIDGLRQSVSRWFTLAERIYELPIKILITTREEDWYRYGADASRLSLKHLKIHMSDVEAENIFNQFKIKNKIHNSIQNWQPAWEKVKDKGLLMEFVYLITFGEMLRERLESQIHELANDSDSAAKIEILRLVALADLCGVKIRSADLIEKIRTEIELHSDRNEVLKSLENEYYIKFENVYVEGLHPVRSEHLSTILHSNIPTEGSLIKLLPLVEQEYIQNYFSSIPRLISDSGKNGFYHKIASLVVIKPLREIAKAVDGLFSGSVLNFWEKNKDIYDEAFDNGLLLFFIADSIPWMKLNMLNGFREYSPNKDKFDYFLRKLDELDSFRKEEFDVFIFLDQSKDLLERREVKDEYEGLGSIIQWFHRFELDCPLVKQIDENTIIRALNLSDINNSSLLAYSYNLTKPNQYKMIAEENKNRIMSFLKLKTNSLTITEDEGSINIKYILIDDLDRANDESVSRIKYIHSFLPYYERYCTEAITPPFPGKEYFKHVPDNSIKMMPKENVVKMMDSSINQLWSKTILSKYEFNSVFEWQKAWHSIRKEALNFIKNSNRLFEALIEGKQNRLRGCIHNLDKSRIELSNLLSSKKDFPKMNSLDLDSLRFSKELDDIRDWEFPLNNFMTQINGILLPKGNNDQNLARINLKDTKNKIPRMQNAFSSICRQTSQYCDFSKIETEENQWYERIFQTISYYLENQPVQDPVFNAKSAISNWWEKKLQNELVQLHDVLTKFEKNSEYLIHKPNKITEDGILTLAVIGISGVNFTNFGTELDSIVFMLRALSDLNIDFYILAFIEEDGKCIVGTRVSRDTLWKIKEGKELDDYNYGYIYSFPLTEEILDTLVGIELKEPTPNLPSNLSVDLMFELWELTETRKRLNKTNKIELEWLAALEGKSNSKIDNLLKDIKNSSPDKFQQYKDISERILKDEFQPTEEYFSDRLNQIIVETTM